MAGYLLSALWLSLSGSRLGMMNNLSLSGIATTWLLKCSQLEVPLPTLDIS